MSHWWRMWFTVDSVTWQVWLGGKTGLFRSAVVLFPLTGNRDRKCAEGREEENLKENFHNRCCYHLEMTAAPT